MANALPNIVILVPHDLGRHLGCYGVPTVSTGAIDALAAGGVRFSNSFCTAPSCSPSRASIFTGRYPHSNGMLGLAHEPFSFELHPGEKHLAELLGAAGYRTAISGHGHEMRDQSRGGHHERLPEGGLDAKVETSLDFMRRSRDAGAPFFLEFPSIEVHRDRVGFGHPGDSRGGVFVPPYLVDEASSREEFALFQGAIRRYDEAVGGLLAGMDALGLTENTILVMTTDHGIPFPRAKCSIYDPGIEVPLILRWPAGGWTGGRVLPQLVSNVDYLPTLLDAAGVPVPENVQGRSLTALLAGQSDSRRDAVFAEMTYHDYYDPRRSIRTAGHKLIVNFTAAPFFMDPSQSWHPACVSRNPADPAYAYHVPIELYDLAANPLEEHNLADRAEHKDTRDDLLHRLYSWMVRTEDPLLDGHPLGPMYHRVMAALEGA